MLALILSLAGIGGIGAAAFAFPAFGALLGGWLKGLLAFLSKIPWQIWLGLAIAGVIAWLAISRGNALDRAQAAEAANATICDATRKAANRPRLDCKQTALQIQYLGEANAKLKGALEHQNGQIDAWKAEAGRQQAAAAEARKAADKRASRAESVAERAKASAAKPPKPGEPCEPSEALRDAWR